MENPKRKRENGCGTRLTDVDPPREQK